ncbi:MAG TPA: D-alanyl-D-alanine carboxypeptidase/D-alanyl-D-alanine-endopeptidase [Chitinophagaceae bacterium]|nr:D-alanyl-D-alanine carboxypeptidase/D-alanyl-D-alanine-endopeptidase [Chitinophagaceae bacterium]
MKKIVIAFYFLLLTFDFVGQTVTQKLQKAFTAFEKDSQLKHAISSLYVIDANSGQVVFDKNSQVGLAPASTQKIITSVTAFELLGKDYRYRTELGYDGSINNGSLKGNLYFFGSGDPTLGSWRWNNTKEQVIIEKFLKALNNEGISKMEGLVYCDISKWENRSVNDGWIWQDIGNYYGAGVSALMWRENQFDIHLRSGKKIGDPVEILHTVPHTVYLNNYISLLSSAAKGTGDNAYATYSPRLLRGTIPIEEKDFVISAAFANGHVQFAWSFVDTLIKRNFGKNINPSIIDQTVNERKANFLKGGKIIYSEPSPSLDSIIYWFNKKSINLYGEALIKTFAYEKNGFGSTDSGVVVVKKFWKEKGMDEGELNIVDGSGLSPLNRVTTHAQVAILKYATSKSWFPYFYNSLPEYNGMKMKSGTIRGVKGFCGYHKAKNGKEYIFSFLVNNYNGSSSSLVNKMYKVLDILK